MLPFDAPPPALGFTTGQRLRPGGGRNSLTGGSGSHKKRPHAVSYGSHNGKEKSPMCTKNRCLLFLVLVVCLTIYFTSRPQHIDAQQTPLDRIQEEIRRKDAERAAMAAGGVQLNGDVAMPPPGVEDPRALVSTTDAELKQTRTDLINSQALVQRLQDQLKKQLESPSLSAAGSPSGASTALSTSRGPIEVPGYPPIAISTSKQFSKFYCIGGRGRLGAQNDRSCRWQNVCYKPSTNEWQFYQDPKEELVVLLDEGRIISEFPPEFLNLRSMGNPQDAQWWSPTIVQSAEGIPPLAFAPRADPAKPDVHILYHPHYPSNMGHVIGDDLFPLFNLMSSFGMLVPDAQLIISRDCAKIFAGQQKKTEQCDFFLNMLLPGLTSKKYLAATEDSFAQKVRGSSAAVSASAPEDLVCFEQLLTGNGPWGFQQSLGKAPSWWAYHAFYLSNLGVNPNRTPKKQRITVSIKKGKRALANNDELVAHLKATFPNHEIDALELKSLGGWKAELEYLLDTSVLITPCGGVSMSAMFLPHNAALIIVDYFNLRKQVSFGMEERLWANLGYIRPFHYPFTRDEVEMPPDHDPNDYQEMRDWGQVRVNVDRMTTIVKAAISHTENFMVFGQE